VSGPFREAFVELTQAAFDAAKQLGEATVEAIVKQADTRAQIEMIHAAVSRRQERHRAILRLIEVLFESLGMRLQRIARESHRDEMTVWVLQACGHPAVYTLDEMRLVLHGSPADLVDYIASSLENDLPLRKCTCMQKRKS
jgi:ATP-dependent RNA circularization protein (DNA/RNA ligase family)